MHAQSGHSTTNPCYSDVRTYGYLALVTCLLLPEFDGDSVFEMAEDRPKKYHHYTEEEILWMLDALEHGLTYADIALEFDVSASNVNELLKRWKTSSPKEAAVCGSSVY